jgi:hypothetical protein
MTATAKSTTVPVMMTIMISFRSEAEKVCRMIRMKDITDRKMTKKKIKTRCEWHFKRDAIQKNMC